MKKSSPLIPYICLVMAMVLWASTFVALKIAFRLYDPMVVIFGRMAVASLLAVFFPFAFKDIQLRIKDIKYIGFMVLCEPCMYFIFEANALVYTSAAQAGMVTSIMPLIVAVGAWILLKEKLSLKTCFGFLIAVTGAVWLSFASKSSVHAPNPLLGNFLEFLAIVCASGYALTLKKLTSRYSPLFLTFIQAFSGTIFFFPVLFLPGTQIPTQVEPVPLLAILYLGSAVTLGAYGFYNYGVSKIPASQATAFINLIPVFGLIMSACFLGERFSPVQYMASAMIFIGVILSQNFKGNRQTSEETESIPVKARDPEIL